MDLYVILSAREKSTAEEAVHPGDARSSGNSCRIGLAREETLAKVPWYPRKMPRRFKALAALLLAIVVCLVLILPQVDLEDGVLNDLQSQVLLLILIGLTTVFAVLLSTEFSQPSREVCLDAAIPIILDTRPSSILRC